MRKNIVETYSSVVERPRRDEFKANAEIAKEDYFARKRDGEMETVEDLKDWYLDWYFYVGHRNMGFIIKEVAQGD